MIRSSLSVSPWTLQFSLYIFGASVNSTPAPPPPTTHAPFLALFSLLSFPRHPPLLEHDFRLVWTSFFFFEVFLFTMVGSKVYVCVFREDFRWSTFHVARLPSSAEHESKVRSLDPGPDSRDSFQHLNFIV